jgi:hypothetical protein
MIYELIAFRATVNNAKAYILNRKYQAPSGMGRVGRRGPDHPPFL